MTTEIKKLKKRLREKRLKREKNLRKAIDKVGKQMMPMPEQGGFLPTLYRIWRDFMLFIGEIKCTFGIHDWRLCSGRPGQPKYACIRCWAKSMTLWEEGGSKKHYEDKHKKNEENKKQ